MSKSGYIGIEKDVYNLLKNHFQTPEELNLVIGVSGGPDSIALFRILRKLGISIHVVHVNYSLREQESDADQELVESICSKFSVPYNVFRLKASDRSGNFQDWARHQRFAILEGKKDQLKADGIALGHHLDDQLETILMKILRGAGLDRWRGMSVWEGGYLRPLLYKPKDEIISYLSEINQTYRTDRSNLKTDYARNLLRHEILNRLDNMIPGWKQNLLRVQQYSQSESELLEDVVARAGNVNSQTIDREYLLKFSGTTQISILLKFIEICLGQSYRQQVARDQLTDISKHLGTLTTGKILNIGKHIRLIRNREQFVLEADNSNTNFEASVKLGKEQLEAQDFIFKDQLHIGLRSEFNQSLVSFQGLVMDAGKLKWPLTLRNWQYGDRIRPMGMQGSQPIADHLTNNKIASNKKREAKVLEGFDQTIYAVIFPANKKKQGTVSHFSQCDDSTNSYLIIKPIYK